jgi:hypothetical protein
MCFNVTQYKIYFSFKISIIDKIIFLLSHRVLSLFSNLLPFFFAILFWDIYFSHWHIQSLALKCYCSHSVIINVWLGPWFPLNLRLKSYSSMIFVFVTQSYITTFSWFLLLLQYMFLGFRIPILVQSLVTLITSHNDNFKKLNNAYT